MRLVLVAKRLLGFWVESIGCKSNLKLFEDDEMRTSGYSKLCWYVSLSCGHKCDLASECDNQCWCGLEGVSVGDQVA